MEYSEDYILLTEKRYYELWKKYLPLQMKYFLKVSFYIRKELYEYDFKEFSQDGYIIMMNAINGLKIEKIKNPKTWSFYIQYSQWLNNFITRNIIRDYCHNYHVSYDSGLQDEDGNVMSELLIGEEDLHDNFEELLSLLSDKDKIVAFRVMYHMPNGGHTISEEGKDLFKKFYTNY